MNALAFIDFFLYKSDARIRKEFNSYLYRTTYLHINFSDKELMSYATGCLKAKLTKISWLRKMEGFKFLPMNGITSIFVKIQILWYYLFWFLSSTYGLRFRGRIQNRL